jgi:hypothetical protein
MARSGFQVTRVPLKGPAPSRPIKKFGPPPAPGPHHNPVNHPTVRSSNALAAEAVRKASDHNSEIDPRQMRDNLN